MLPSWEEIQEQYVKKISPSWEEIQAQLEVKEKEEEEKPVIGRGEAFSTFWGKLPEMPKKEEAKKIVTTPEAGGGGTVGAFSEAKNIPQLPETQKILQEAKELPYKFETVSERITRQLKEGTYVKPTEKKEKESAFTGVVATFGMMLTKLPRQIAASILQATQGKEGASVVEPDWADKYIQKANEDIEGFVEEAKRKYGTEKFMGISISDLAQLPQSAAYSITSMAGGLAVGAPMAAIPLPGFRVAAYVAGTAASGTVAYNATTYQIMQTYLELMNPKTKAEEEKLKKDFDEKAHRYGLWEAIPEAISNLSFFSLLTAPLAKIVGSSKAMKIINKVAGIYGEELLTETITQMGQTGIEAEAGISEEEPRKWTSPQDWLKSFKEVFPQTFLLTTLLSGAGGSMIAAKDKINKVEKSLEKEIGKDHPSFNQVMDNVEQVFTKAPEKEVPQVDVSKITTDIKSDISKETDKIIKEEMRKADIKLPDRYTDPTVRNELITKSQEMMVKIDKTIEETIKRKADIKPVDIPIIKKEIMGKVENIIKEEVPKLKPGERKIEPKLPEVKLPETKEDLEVIIDKTIEEELPKIGIKLVDIDIPKIREEILPKVSKSIENYAKEQLKIAAKMPEINKSELAQQVVTKVQEITREELHKVEEKKVEPIREEFDRQAEHDYAKKFDELPVTQKRKVIEATSKEKPVIIPDKKSEYINIIGVPTKGFAFPTDYFQLYVTAKKDNVATDSHILFTEPEIVKKITTEWDKKFLEKEIKPLKKAGLSITEAEKEASNYLKKAIEETPPLDKKDTFGLVEDINKEAHKQPAQIQGHEVTEDFKITYLSDGQTQTAINTNFLSFFNKYLPEYTLHLQDNKERPITIKVKDKVVGVVMPVRVDNFPFAIEDIRGKIKEPPTKEEPVSFRRPKERFLEKEPEKGIPLSARAMGEKLAIEPETEKRINKTQIMTWAEKAFNTPIKGKATFRWKKAAGRYYPKEQIIRMEKWGELATATHELAHSLDFKTFRKEIGSKWRTPNTVITKELADLDYDPKQRRTEEGFAEYMRYRLTTDEASKMAPNFHKYFNEEILPKFPEIKKKLDQFKDMLDTWNKQGAENRVIQHIDWEGEHQNIKGIMPKLKKALEWLNIRFNDEFYSSQRLTKEIEKALETELRPTMNPAKMMAFSKSTAGAIARTFVMEKAIDEHGNVVGDGLIDILKPIPEKEMKQFVAYGVSKRVINLEGRGIESGFDIDDANYIIDKYKDKGWDKTVDKVTEWCDHILDWLVNAGAFDEETAKLFKLLNPIYLPFKRAFLDEIKVYQGAGGYVDTGKGIKAIKGGGEPIINPMEAMVIQMRELIAKAQKIRIAKTFIDIAEREGMGGFITEVPAPVQAITFNASQIKEYLDNITAEAKKEGEISLNKTQYDELLTVFTQDWEYKGKENIVSIWKNGKRKFYEIHPDLYEALKGIDPLKLGPIGKLLNPFAKLQRLGATGLKFSFGFARNPFRDAFSYAVFSKRNNATIFDPIKGYYKDITCKSGDLAWRFKALGGGLSGQIGFDRASVQFTYDEMFHERLGKKGKTLWVVKHPFIALQDLLSITEMGPRIAELEASYKKYTSEEWLKDHPDWTEEDAYVQAHLDAQDVTINFTKSGKWGKQINQISAFYNVSIRGPEKLYRSFKERPIQTLVKGIAWCTLIALGNWYKNKDEDWYKNLPPAYKYNNLWFEIGDNIYRLPIPFELGMIFMSAPQAAMDTWKNKDDQAYKGLLELAKSQIPDPTPSAFRGAYEVAKNKNWLGIPIESPGMQYLYPTERKRDYTTKLAIALSKGANKIGIKLSPIQIDYLIDSYSGGFLKQFRITGDELADYPVIGDLVLRDPGYPDRQLNEFFSDYELLGQKRSSGIANKDELRKYAKIKGFYDYYKAMQNNIKKAKEKKNDKLLKLYYKMITDKLAKYGYE